MNSGNKVKQLWLVLALITLLSACNKKEYPPSFQMSGNPVVYLHATVDNQSVSLVSGESGNTCRASYTQGKDSLYLFTGEIGNTTCFNCYSTFRLQLSDIKTRAPGVAVPADQVLKPGKRNWLSELNSVFTSEFSARSNIQIKHLSWRIDDGLVLTDTAIRYSFSKAGEHKLSLTINTVNNCETTVEQKIFVDDANGFFAAQVSASKEQGNGVRFRPTIQGGKAPFSYRWTFTDGSETSQESALKTFITEGAFPVKLVVKDAANHTCETNYIYVTDKDNSSCTAEIKMPSVQQKITAFNGVRLVYKDANNVKYQSGVISQPQDAYFEIIDSAPYEPNENGESTQLLTFRFSVLMQSANKQIRIKSEKATMIVAYKK